MSEGIREQGSGNREQGTEKGGSLREFPPMRDRAAHEWGTQNDFVCGPPAEGLPQGLKPLYLYTAIEGQA